MSATHEVFLGRYQLALRKKALEIQAAIEDDTARTLLEGSRDEELRSEFEALKQEARDAGAVVVVKQLGNNAWREIKKNHPPRRQPDVDAETERGDRFAGCNVETVSDDFLCATIVTPEFKSRAAFDEWMAGDPLTPGEYDAVFSAAWGLTHGAPFDPGSLPDSPTLDTEQN